jgi:ATP-dependent Lon protease
MINTYRRKIYALIGNVKKIDFLTLDQKNELIEELEEKKELCKSYVENPSDKILNEIIEFVTKTSNRVTQLNKMAKNKEILVDLMKYKNDFELPTFEDVFKLTYVPYEEKRNLVVLIDKAKESNDADEKIIVTKLYNNLLSLKTKQEQEIYKNMSSSSDLSYVDILNSKKSIQLKKKLITGMKNAIITMEDKSLFKKTIIEQCNDSDDDSDIEQENQLLTKIKQCSLPQKYKKFLRSIYYTITDPENSAKKIEYIERAIKIPYNKIPYDLPTNTCELYTKFKTMLDKELYGMNGVKEDLITTMCCLATSKDIRYKIIALCGPPGTGKTTIGRIIAKVFKIPFEQISMNTITSNSDLTGMEYTYDSAQYGRIANAMINMKCSNGLLFLDEFDKIQTNQNSKSSDISNALINICDTTQNHEFTDNYFRNIKIDLSNLLIVCSLNDSTNINPILANRAKFVHVKGYSDDEKIKICEIMLNKMYTEFDISDVTFSNQVIKYLIAKVKDIEVKKQLESGGVRELETILKHIIERIKILIHTRDKNFNSVSYNIKNFKLPYSPTIEDIEILTKTYGLKYEMTPSHMYL